MMIIMSRCQRSVIIKNLYCSVDFLLVFHRKANDEIMLETKKSHRKNMGRFFFLLTQIIMKIIDFLNKIIWWNSLKFIINILKIKIIVSMYQRSVIIKNLYWSVSFVLVFHWKANDVMMLENKIFHRKNMDRFFFYWLRYLWKSLIF